MRVAARALFAVYLVLLLWLILFKLSFHPFAALARQTRHFNVLPFADPAQGSLREPLLNIVVFIPLGLLLGVNLKRASFRRKLAGVFILSLAAEVTQFVFAIGVADTTDLITNTAGGLLGLLLYAVGQKALGGEKLDRFIVLAGGLVLIACGIFLGILFSQNIRFRSAT